ncbi:MAG: TonB-dependent receptor plug domain-containing protein, partial [Bacteroidales bacterium]|nr:TonB-dependent receptor plug domain-containing protein [Bacteroidales bacterium]
MRVSILFILVSFISLTLSSQTLVSGFVYDAETKEAIIGANIIDIDNVSGTTSNNQAYYSLKIKSNKIKISFIGYQTDTISLKQAKDTIVNIFLKPLAYQIDEVIIQAVSMKPINVQNLNIKEIKNLPSLGAQPDVIKSAQILPGIQSQGEASSMLIVRGGDPGQNMFILDNTPLIYVNHLGGFMSVFNPDIINDITIYKTGFPAKYGGKLSSIFDITQRSGNSKEFNGSFGIGVTDANLSLEGKLSDNMTYIVTGRKTLFDVLLFGASALSDGGDYYVTYGFHDINFKTVWKANSKNTFSINLFQGDDYLNVWNKKINITQNTFKTKLRNIWGNLMGAASWNSIISPKVFAKTNVSYSSYRVSDIQAFTDFENNQKLKNKFTTKVQDISLNSVFTTNVLTNWNLIGGLHFSYLKSNPYDYKVLGNVNSHTVMSEEITNSALSLSNKIELFKIIETDIGARLGYYFLSDTSEFFFEPRLDLNININKTSSLNLNFMQVSQASHLMISSG